MLDVYSKTASVRRDDVEIVYADHGPEDGTPVLMIHGFPDSARLWRHQITVLNRAGYRVIAPDLRGYGRSDKPEDVGAYVISEVAEDMLSVLDDADIDRAHVVGHDWGGAIAWYLAIRHPDRLRSLTAVSVGHPTAFREAGLRQLEKSWYMLLFQFEGVAEAWLSGNDWQTLRNWARTSSELEHWIEDLSRPGALTAALGIYRANMGPERLLRSPMEMPPIQVPTMGVWSSDDMALTEKQMTASEKFVSAEWRYEKIEGTSHWIPTDAPDRLNQLLLDWLVNH